LLRKIQLLNSRNAKIQVYALHCKRFTLPQELRVVMRDDIAVVPWAVDNGFTAEVVDPVIKTRTTQYKQGDIVPAACLSFRLGELRAWGTEKGWRFALLKDGRYTGHSVFFENVKSCLGALLARS